MPAEQDAYPSAWAFKVYLGLMAYELVLALILPGKTQKGTCTMWHVRNLSRKLTPATNCATGLPVPSLGYKQLTYHCNGAQLAVLSPIGSTC